MGAFQNFLCSVRTEELLWRFRLTRFALSVSAKRLHWCTLASVCGGEVGLRDVTLADEERRRRTVAARYPDLLSLPFAAEVLALSGCCR